MFSSQFCHEPASPWMKTIGGSPSPMSTTFTRRPATSTNRRCARQSTSIHAERPVGPYGPGSVGSAAAGGIGAGKTGARARHRPAGRGRSTASRRRAAAPADIIGPRRTMRIAIDIDSTLHHYWPLLSAAAKRRFGIELPYDRQFTWAISRLREEQLRVCVADTHSDDAIAKAEPYPHAVETVNAWHDAGHWIHVTSHRAEHCHPATARWLDRIGLHYDDLYCSYDKVGRCREIGIDILIDDSPVNIAQALDAGLVAATLRHPWNEDVCAEEDVICGQDWPELARRLAPVLDGDRHAA